MQGLNLSLIIIANPLPDTLGTKLVFLSSSYPFGVSYSQEGKKNTHAYLHLCLFAFCVGRFKHSVNACYAFITVKLYHLPGQSWVHTVEACQQMFFLVLL